MARTAVVAGTATAVSGNVQRRQMSKAEAQQAEAQQAAAPPPPVASAPAAAGGDDLTAQLMKLAELHGAGVLSDEEFAAGKAKLLA